MGCASRMAFFGVRLPQAGFSFPDASLVAVPFPAMCRLGYAGLLSGLRPWAGMAYRLLPLPVMGLI